MPRSRKAIALTAIRGPVHGNFAEGAGITQSIMDMLSKASSWPRMNAAQKESVHMIVHKVHRIVTGNPNHQDHWDDIAGYAHLGAQSSDGMAPAPVALTRVRKRVKKPAAKKVRARPVKKARKAKVGGPVSRRPVAARPSRNAAKRVVKKAAKKRVRKARAPAPAVAAPAQAEA